MNISRIKQLLIISFCLMALLTVKILHCSTFQKNKFIRAVNSQCKTVKEIVKIRKTIFDRNNIPLTERCVKFFNLTFDGELKSSSDKSFEGFPVFERHCESSPATHLIGYVSPDGTGLSGVEKQYNSKLVTSDSFCIEYESDAVNRPMKNAKPLKNSFCPLPDGVKLTIDYHIQRIAENVLNEHISKGCVVIMDVKNFQVLAMASNPGFDSTDISTAANESDSPLLNRALCAYNAGSIYKIVTAAAMLEKDPGYLNTYFMCNGKYDCDPIESANHIFRCHKPEGHGYHDFIQGFANSCNCTFFETGINAGGKEICDMAKKFGFGVAAIKLGNEEASGNVMQKETYTEIDILNMSIGQGDVLVTPIQCTVMAATIANGGIRKDVSISAAHLSSKNYYVTSPETSMIIGKMMRECVLSGTAKSAASSPIEIAGKTGSAETGWLTENNEFAVHGWFCGFFPYSNPKYAMTVFCENGKSGAESCVVPFVKICEEINKFYPIKQ